MGRIFLSFLMVIGCAPALFAQYNNKLVDGRNSDPFCRNFEQLLRQKPKEVLFGIDLQDNGDVYFTMNNEEWFHKLFTPGTAMDDWARELIEVRIDKLDVSEDLLFYYVNLGFFRSAQYGSEKFRKALLNASVINRERFCQYFHAVGRGGVGMQLLENNMLRQLYCESCVTQKM